jgi:hypothetical protein
MKLKNLAFFGVMASILSVASAQAAEGDNYIASKGYVDAKVQDVSGDVSGKQDALTEAQLNAVNSGITAAKVNTYDGYATGKQDTLTSAQLNAVNSGITADKVAAYDAYDTALDGKQDTLTEAQLNAVNSGITATDKAAYDAYATGKQDTLTETQLAAVDSGINSTKVAAYDAYAAQIAGKQDTVGNGTVNATTNEVVTGVTTTAGVVTAVSSALIADANVSSTANVAPSKLNLSQSTCPSGRTCLLTYNASGNYEATPITNDDDLQ